MRKLLAAALVGLLLLSGCSGVGREPERKVYEASFLTLFDTVTTIKGFARDEEEFRELVQPLHDELLEYHQLFDIYNEYDGINNLKTVNDSAGKGPVEVDERIIRLLQDCRGFYEATDGKVNVALGGVLALWHEARSDGRDDPVNARLPEWEQLVEAGEHTDFDAVEIDVAASTIRITDPAVRLDVGAVAKGWAVEQVAQGAPAGLLISVGGNICATGPKDEEGTPWIVGIQDPKGGESYLHTVYVTDGCVVTSGDYQRTYVVDGVFYHHIIDPETLYPSDYWSSVSIVCDDSAVADALSTALFLLPQVQGQALLERYQAEAVWIDTEGQTFYSPGFQELIRT